MQDWPDHIKMHFYRQQVNHLSYLSHFRSSTRKSAKRQNVLLDEIPKWLHKEQERSGCLSTTHPQICIYCIFRISFFIFMFEPLLFHLFFLYSAIRMINFSLKTFKLIISSLLSSFSNRYLFVVIILSFETFFHLFYFMNKSENFIGKKTSLSLIPLHSMVNIFQSIFFKNQIIRFWWVSLGHQLLEL